MTQEDKKLLLKDLCARFPYGVIVNVNGEDFKLLSINDYRLLANPISLKEKTGFSIHVKYSPKIFYLEEARPYLRSMSSMTEEEEKERLSFFQVVELNSGLTPLLSALKSFEYINWLNAHHFNYRGLIEKGLALEAPKGMYNPYKE